MANKAVKDYNDFTGTNGYLIVDGLTDNESGGKMKVPNYSGVIDGYVLTKTTTNGSDDVVWSAPAGGIPDPQDLVGKIVGSAASIQSCGLMVKYNVTTDSEFNNVITAVGQPYWGA